MGHDNCLLYPSAVQFTDQLQSTVQKMPQAPHKGKMVVQGHKGNVAGEALQKTRPNLAR